MRIVHTADWHVGRLWKSISRLDETARVLDSLARYLEREKIDLLLVAGDVFDTSNPGADAEQLVFQFFRRLGANNIPTVVIAGNHDSPGRMDAYGTLADLAGVYMVGRPRSLANGGVIEVCTKQGEIAQVAALPFAAPGVFASAMSLEQRDVSEEQWRVASGEWPEKDGPLFSLATRHAPLATAPDSPLTTHHYAQRFQQASAHLARSFRPDRVNLLMAHTSLDGAVLANSERQAHIGEEWTASAHTLPEAAQYVALGHIHKPQRLEAANVPTEYCGSLLQLDFGEAGQKKSFVVVDVQPGQPARIEHVPTEGSKELVDLKMTLSELDARQADIGSSDWLRVTVVDDQPIPDLARKVRQHLANALVVRFEPRPSPGKVAAEERESAQSGKKPLEIYRDYHQRHYERPAETAVEEAFQQLYEKCED